MAKKMTGNDTRQGSGNSIVLCLIELFVNLINGIAISNQTLVLIRSVTGSSTTRDRSFLAPISVGRSLITHVSDIPLDRG